VGSLCRQGRRRLRAHLRLRGLGLRLHGHVLLRGCAAWGGGSTAIFGCTAHLPRRSRIIRRGRRANIAVAGRRGRQPRPREVLLRHVQHRHPLPLDGGLYGPWRRLLRLRELRLQLRLRGLLLLLRELRLLWLLRRRRRGRIQPLGR
jgi:hypothetical protein